MRWLIIQSDGQHKGQDTWAPNWFLRECYGIQDALLRNGHQAEVWGLRHPNYAVTPDFNSYDYILIAENYEFDWIPDLSGTKPVKIQWIIDLHYQNAGPYLRICERLKPQIVLHATKKLMAGFEIQYPAKHIYFPNAIDDRYFNPARHTDEVKSRRIIFVGGRGTREEILLKMEREAGLECYYGVTGYEYIKLLAMADIQFNKALDCDVNYRNFETIAMGTCLLTDYSKELEALGFYHGENCLTYMDPRQAVGFARDALNEPEYRQSIAQRGQALSLLHTYTARIATLLKQL